MSNNLRTFPVKAFFHICNKSIANFGIFRKNEDSLRFLRVLDYYNHSYIPEKFSKAIKKKSASYQYDNIIGKKSDALLKIISYCIMLDHYHLLIKILADDILSKYINDIENSFTRYFNVKNKRKGPLWQSHFRAVRMESNEQLLHVSRYIHLNPTTANLVTNPEDWQNSSYRDYINIPSCLEDLSEISIQNPVKYREFVENQIDYQRNLKRIKKLLLE